LTGGDYAHRRYAEQSKLDSDRQLQLPALPQAALPDFSWYKMPKIEKYTKFPRFIPNVHKI
jgi:hypothetical protein